jgi:predicted acylesterase/phospholipase RssA
MGNYTSPEQAKDSIAFSGGGVCGVAHVGVMKAATQLEMNFTKFAGASVGSIVASLCAVKVSSDQLEELMDFDFAELLDDDYGVIRDTTRLWKESGYYKGDALHNKIRQCLGIVCGDPDITFDALNRYETELFIPVTLVWKTHCETKVYSIGTTPDESIALACRMSCTYPAVFRSLNSTSDGGILCNYPIILLPEGQRLGVRLTHQIELKYEPVENLAEYSTSIICTLHTNLNKDIDEENTIRVPISLSSMEFSITKEERQELIAAGYNAAMNYLSK